MQNNNKNILLATILSAMILVSWTWLYEKPRLEKIQNEKKLELEKKSLEKSKTDSLENNQESSYATSENIKNNLENIQKEDAKTILKNRVDVINETKNFRIPIENQSVIGSIYLKGARIDDLILKNYFKNAKKEENVVLFSPSNSKERYFVDFGWISAGKLQVPNPDTLWKASSNKLTPEKPIILSWINDQKIEFIIEISIDESYMFKVKQTVKNNSNIQASIASYGRVNRIRNSNEKPNYILHEGAIGAFDKVLQEKTYQDITKEKKIEFTSLAESGGWLGITDKYWLSAIIPDNSISYIARFDFSSINQDNIFNSQFVSREYAINPGESVSLDHHVFSGAKKVRLLDQYAKDFNIKLFDRAIDFGWFYFLTKPFFFIIEFLYKILGNFGLAIIAMTVLIKIILFPMANKSYIAIGKIKQLQPRIDVIREKYKGDKIAMNKEIMEFYKKEKVNPAAGCLPVLIQIPVFFALYKVLFVTLDMRHAPFYGWIKDLSSSDPTSIFNLFGLLPFEVNSTFTIGVWPILMGITMVVQQKLNPSSSDPIQAKILKWMPYVLTVVLSTFPAGLIIYWTWSNILSIAQQWFITKKLLLEKK